MPGHRVTHDAQTDKRDVCHAHAPSFRSANGSLHRQSPEKGRVLVYRLLDYEAQKTEAFLHAKLIIKSVSDTTGLLPTLAGVPLMRLDIFAQRLVDVAL